MMMKRNNERVTVLVGSSDFIMNSERQDERSQQKRSPAESNGAPLKTDETPMLTKILLFLLMQAYMVLNLHPLLRFFQFSPRTFLINKSSTPSRTPQSTKLAPAGPTIFILNHQAITNHQSWQPNTLTHHDGLLDCVCGVWRWVCSVSVLLIIIFRVSREYKTILEKYK
jgi:hypothetical protein